MEKLLDFLKWCNIPMKCFLSILHHFKNSRSLSIILLYGVGGSSGSISYGRMKMRTVQLKMKTILSKSPKSWNIWLRPSPLFWQNLPKFIKMSHGFFKEFFLSQNIMQNWLSGIHWGFFYQEFKFCIDSPQGRNTYRTSWLTSSVSKISQ